MIGILLLILFAVIIYFLPTIIAYDKRHKYYGSIGCINLFLGWTIIGWVGALAWAVTNQVEEETDVTKKVKKK